MGDAHVNSQVVNRRGSGVIHNFSQAFHFFGAVLMCPQDTGTYLDRSGRTMEMRQGQRKEASSLPANSNGMKHGTWNPKTPRENNGAGLGVFAIFLSICRRAAPEATSVGPPPSSLGFGFGFSLFQQPPVGAFRFSLTSHFRLHSGSFRDVALT